MLSAAGAQTRPSARPPAPDPVTALAPPEPATTVPGESAAAAEPVAAPPPQPDAPATPADEPADAAPRTLRLRAGTAGMLRAAWLEAKRDDVLLTAQDFASNLVDEALAMRRRRARASRTA
jgi:hypothetical protein